MKKIEDREDHKNLRASALKYLLNHNKNRHELDNKSRKQCNIIFIDEKLAIKVIMNCKIRLGFKQYDVILTKEQSVLTKTMRSFEGENMQAQYVLSYRID